MKTQIARVVRSLSLSVVFVVTFFTPLLSRLVDGPGLRTVHIVSGLLLLSGSLVHIATNAGWIRKVMAQPAGQLPKRVQRLRVVDMALFVSALACGVSGGMSALGLGDPGLHGLSGLAMSLALFIHLLQHWSWLVNAIRGLRKGEVSQRAAA